ncbi:hypothetical protein QBC35DRAFT_439218 [Podospora australis]|uniref:Cylicin I n=1 Tax=Podospora australis TaxID=1536484 RepID=A0AAN6WP82_9PEZI|nr:hypothetical protein QBC35DRAFT_439218 [Podospora australis]
MASEGSAAAEPAKQSYSTDPALYIYTSLTAGSSHIVTATSRLETILRANRVPFKAIDIAVDEKARMLWGRRAGKDANGRLRKLPGLVQMGLVLGDLVEIEEWNEYGELKQHVTIYYDEFTIPAKGHEPPVPVYKNANKPVAPPAAPPMPAPKTASAATPSTPTKSSQETQKMTLPIRSIAEEAAKKAKQNQLQALRDKVHGKGNSSSPTSAPSSLADATAKLSISDDAQKENKLPEGLQSPTSSGWKGAAGIATTGLAAAVQSPTTTSWKPTDVDPPVTNLHGSVVAPASKEEIAAVERSQTIKEETSEEEDSEEEEESSEDESSEEEKTKKPAAAAATK